MVCQKDICEKQHFEFGGTIQWATIHQLRGSLLFDFSWFSYQWFLSNIFKLQNWDVIVINGRGGFSLVLMDWCLIHHLLLVFYFTPSKMWFAYFTWYFTCPIKMWFAASAGDQIVFSSNNIEQWLAMTRGKCLKTQSYSTSPSSKGWFLSSCKKIETCVFEAERLFPPSPDNGRRKKSSLRKKLLDCGWGFGEGAPKKIKIVLFKLGPKIVIVLVLRTPEHLEFSPILQTLPEAQRTRV